MGLTQREIAHKIGKGETYISRIEHGRGSFSTKSVGQLARALGYRIELKLVPVKCDLCPTVKEPFIDGDSGFLCSVCFSKHNKKARKK